MWHRELTARYKHYVPLRGHDEFTAEDIFNYGIEGTYYSSPLKTAKGRKSRADDPFAYIEQMAYTAIAFANENMLKQGLLRISKYQDTRGLMSADSTWYVDTGHVDADGNPVWEVKYPEHDNNPATYDANIARFKQEMMDKYAKGEARQAGAKFDLNGLFIKRSQKAEHEVTVFENGVEHTIYINADPSVARSINGADRKFGFGGWDVSYGRGADGKWHIRLNDNEKTGDLPHSIRLSIPGFTRWKAANTTARNPAFMAPNMVRDFGQAISTLPAKEGFAYAGAFSKNMPIATAAITRYFRGKVDYAGNKYDRYVLEFIMNGGQTVITHVIEIERTKKDISKRLDKLVKQKEKAKTTKKRQDNVILGSLQMLADISENSCRLATYFTSREMGRDVQRSVSDAKEVTVNFNRQGDGDWGAAYFRQLYMFANANIQGLATLGRLTKKNPKGMASACVS